MRWLPHTLEICLYFMIFSLFCWWEAVLCILTSLSSSAFVCLFVPSFLPSFINSSWLSDWSFCLSVCTRFPMRKEWEPGKNWTVMFKLTVNHSSFCFKYIFFVFLIHAVWKHEWELRATLSQTLTFKEKAECC